MKKVITSPRQRIWTARKFNQIATIAFCALGVLFGPLVSSASSEQKSENTYDQAAAAIGKKAGSQIFASVEEMFANILEFARLNDMNSISFWQMTGRSAIAYQHPEMFSEFAQLEILAKLRTMLIMNGKNENRMLTLLGGQTQEGIGQAIEALNKPIGEKVKAAMTDLFKETDIDLSLVANAIIFKEVLERAFPKLKIKTAGLVAHQAVESELYSSDWSAVVNDPTGSWQVIKNGSSQTATAVVHSIVAGIQNYEAVFPRHDLISGGAVALTEMAELLAISLDLGQNKQFKRRLQGGGIYKDIVGRPAITTEDIFNNLEINLYAGLPYGSTSRQLAAQKGIDAGFQTVLALAEIMRVPELGRILPQMNLKLHLVDPEYRKTETIRIRNYAELLRAKEKILNHGFIKELNEKNILYRQRIEDEKKAWSSDQGSQARQNAVSYLEERGYDVRQFDNTGVDLLVTQFENAKLGLIPPSKIKAVQTAADAGDNKSLEQLQTHAQAQLIVNFNKGTDHMITAMENWVKRNKQIRGEDRSQSVRYVEDIIRRFRSLTIRPLSCRQVFKP